MEEADEVVAGAVTATATEATMILEEDWEDPPIKRSISSLLVRVSDPP